MADDVVTPSNPLVAPIEEKELEEASLDMNVSQRLHNKNPFRKVVYTRVDHSARNCRSSPNPHTLSIYLKFDPARGATLERFKKCQCENNDVRIYCQTCVPDDSHYRWLQSPINPLPMECQTEYLTHTIRRLLDFLQL